MACLLVDCLTGLHYGYLKQKRMWLEGSWKEGVVRIRKYRRLVAKRQRVTGLLSMLGDEYLGASLSNGLLL
jgi:hypothetical protein